MRYTGILLVLLITAAAGTITYVETRSLPGTQVSSIDTYIQQNVYDRTDDTVVEEHDEQPNVILIMMDAIRPDHIGPCYGYKRATAPNMCDFADEAVTFKQAYAQGTATTLATPPLITSQLPNMVGFRNFTRRIPYNATTVAETLQANGFTTFSFGKGANIGFTDGIEHTIQHISQTKQRADEPMFVWRFFHEIHQPYLPKDEYRKWENFTIPEKLKSVYISKEGSLDNFNITVEEWTALYDEELLQVDSSFGEMINDLKHLGMYKDSLIIVTSDHGQMMGEREALSHSNVPYEGVSHIPLMIKFPASQHAGTVVDQPVRQVDIVPTVYDFLDLSTTPDTYGTSLLPAVNGKDLNLPAFSAQRPHWDWMIRYNKYKYFLLNMDYCLDDPDPVHEALYNIEKDPDETDNLADKHPEKVADLRSDLCEIYRHGEKNAYPATPNRNYSQSPMERFENIDKAPD